MKYLILLFPVLVLSLSTYATTPNVLQCSRAGTDVVLVNGISWGRDDVEDILYKYIELSIPKNHIDNKFPSDSYVKFKFSYNHSNGFLRDMLESAVQKVSQNFNISAGNAFVAAYYFTYKGVVTADFIESIYNAKGVTFSGISNYLISYFSPSTLDKMIQDSFNANVTDTMSLKASISDILLNGKKLILITESQGNFFGKQAIQDFLNGESLNAGGKTGRINDYLGTIGQLQIAPPTGSLLPKNKVVLNDRDIINLVFFERPDSNFILIPPSPDSRRVEIDRFANHFITSTYLNTDNMTTGNLSSLRDFTLQSVVDLASSLDSNCPKAVINYTKNNLIVNFDSTDPEDPDVKDLTYTWDFGDGQILDTKSKIFSHSYAQAGTYRVSLTVTDAYGASDTIQEPITVSSGDLVSVTICNAGLLDNVMNFQIDGVEPFSLQHFFPESGYNHDPHTCECKTIQVPINQSTNIYVTGTDHYTGQSLTLTPYSGSIYPHADYNQPFSTSAEIVNNNLVIGVYRGIFARDRCGIIITK